MLSAAIAAVGIVVAGVLVFFGRRDLTRPAVSFGVPWFLAVALAQVNLTRFSKDWSLEFAMLAIGGGLSFVFAATLASGSERARGAIRIPDRGDYDSRRILIAAVLLLAGGVFGWWLYSRILGAVPLFAGDIDETRTMAYGDNEVALPSYVTFLTDGCFLGGWALLVFGWMRWQSLGVAARAALLCGLAAAAVGALAGGSRNVLVFATAVPLIAIYAATSSMPRRVARYLAAAAACMVLVFSAFFLVRSNANPGARSYLSMELAQQPQLLRPLVPVYISATYPLEAERRLAEARPERFSPAGGSVTLASLPDAVFPRGKSAFGSQLAAMTNTGETTPTWTVGTYQGRVITDFGTSAVLPFSLLLGLAFGLAYRACRGRQGFLPLAAVAVIAYYSAFMAYDSLLSFSLIAFYDLTVVGAVELFSRTRQGAMTETETG